MRRAGTVPAPAQDDTGDADRAHDDLRVVAMAKADRRAFAPLYERYAEPIYFFCYRRLGSADDAADATAIVFTRALGALGTFDARASHSGSTFRAWLYTIARNVVTDIHRRSRPHASLDGPDAPVIADHAATPEAHAIGAEEARLVSALLSSLPDRQRAVVEFRLAGLSMAEIASSLDITVSAAKSLQVRAYRTLRAHLHANPTALSREHMP